MTDTYIFLDIETTGLNPETDEIIEIGAIAVRRGKVVDRYHTLLNPGRKLPVKIITMTGLTDDMLRDAPIFSEEAEKLLSFIGESPIFGHNISFDISFLQQKTGFLLLNPCFDTIDLVQVVLPGAESYRLETVKQLLGVDRIVSHRALDDAEAAWETFQKCIEIFNCLDNEVLFKVIQVLRKHQTTFAKTLNQQITEAVTRFPNTKKAVPEQLFNLPDHANEGLDIGGLEEYLKPEGIFAQINPKFRYRQGQADMLKTVSEGFREDKHIVIEAGTGTGKSLAYLLPAVVWALTDQTKVVVSTHTINLQEQLLHKDLPQIRDIAGINFKAALVKGRNNYICIRRWEEMLKSAADSGDIGSDNKFNHREAVFCLKILVWLTMTVSGERSELNFSPDQVRYWNEINSEQDYCIGPGCRWYARRCFVNRARKQAESADLLVVNHSLLLADIKVQNKLLPSYEYLVIDEAHHLEDSATQQLGWTVSFTALKSVILSVNRSFVMGGKPGLLFLLRQVSQTYSWKFSDSVAKLEEFIADAKELVSKNINSINEIEEFFIYWVSRNYDENHDNTCRVFRIKQHHREDASWKAYESIKENYIFRTSLLEKLLGKISGLLYKEDEEEECKEFISMIKDIEYQRAFLREVISQINLFYDGETNSVHWVEVQRGEKTEVRFCSAPISVSKMLSENLFLTKKSILLTSATISIDGKFDHFMERTGLSLMPEEKVITRLIQSPFVYERQSLLCVVRDIPEPSSVCDAEYIHFINPIIRDIAKIFRGRTLVLFTSHKMLRESYYKLHTELESEGIKILGHRIDGGRTRLANEFRKNPCCVLYGSGSFWEGIDLPGDMLQCVIIVRLPFLPPNSPIVEARTEELVKENRDPFLGFTVPEAVIQLKQGFGRLIRTEEDEGVVVVLDRRLVEKRYGRKFLDSLPIKNHIKGDTPTVLQKISDWHTGERTDFQTLNFLENASDVNKQLEVLRRKRTCDGESI
ncbi:helicase C-terminal domain-containing protein [Phosphitispora sp. TUW77]|uniref:helicase C-terminal domain-containing protein n=1 Tax=Phosphitispora sp. TUW77 TaxID=3152361 RepID=UPI003AB13D15